MHYLLFTTSTCQKCPSFKKALAESLTIPGRIINEQDGDFSRLANEFTVSSVPTLIVFEDEKGQYALLRTSEIAELKHFASAHAH